jgi:hypothetical protein
MRWTYSIFVAGTDGSLSAAESGAPPLLAWTVARCFWGSLEFYVKWLATAGLGVVVLLEPPVPVLKADPERNDYDHWLASIPTMLGMAARRIRSD